MDKLSEETEELCQAIQEAGNVEEELGDVLFAAVNVARFVHSDPEDALNRATDKFISRFQKVEQAARDQGRRLEEMTLEEMDKLWEQAKHPLKQA